VPWARLDDSLHSHRKLRRAGLEATGLYAMALSYCAAYLTDGHVDEDFLAELVPSKRRRERLLEELVRRHLFEPNGHGYAVHDYLDYNPSRADIERRRELAAERKRKERHAA
jgi:hypothetical protein